MQPDLSARAAREVQRDTPFRRARTCYRHLAGVAGVGLLDDLLRHGWLTTEGDGIRPRYRLTPAGTAALRDRGVEGTAAGHACLDWTERRPHLGGPLGAAVLRALEDANVLRREDQPRHMRLCMPTEGWLTSPSPSL